MTRCPRCNSPSPELHPAVQHEGEVQICPDLWHQTVRTATEAARKVLDDARSARRGHD